MKITSATTHEQLKIIAELFCERGLRVFLSRGNDVKKVYYLEYYGGEKISFICQPCKSARPYMFAPEQLELHTVKIINKEIGDSIVPEVIEILVRAIAAGDEVGVLGNNDGFYY